MPDEVSNTPSSPRTITVPEDALRKELLKLIDERDRYREVLEQISRWPAAGVAQRAAQEALRGV